MTNHFDDPNLRKFWQNLLGQQNVILLEDPEKICEAIVGAVAICEEHIGIADLKTDGLDVGSALVPLSQAVPAAAGVPGISGLPSVPGGGRGTERL
jgi:MFS superfamily sulfate permease-like transporter